MVAVNALSLYRQALSAADTAYDRTLLASAKSLGESLEIVGQGDAARVRATVPYSALEAFEADNRSRMFYKVSGFRGEWVSGFEDLPPWRGQLPAQGLYAALVHFYNDRYRDQAVRVAVLLQPVASAEGRGMATIQVAETLELRETLARRILFDTLWRQAALLAVIAGVVVWVVQHALQPVRRLSTAQELRPLLDATNHVMARLDELLGHQRRFVRDTAHQLRTPLAVLKTQVQSARRGDLPAEQALAEIDGTVARATTLANQMLSLAKVEQLRQQGVAPVEDWAPAAREVALDLAALVAERQLDFSIDTVAAPVRVHAWALRELTRNLLHNAIRHCPPGGPLAISLRREDGQAVLRLVDSGPGLAPGVGERLFQPFSTALSAGGHLPGGTGLGLAICRDIVDAAGGRIVLRNREDAAGAVLGLEACVQLPLADNPA
ncbi:sensor histidine kinase [Piscinibacter sakaiensis]|uniref:sensor histidine kinase n=1 Tax=Piscinibacter sakaiensis TaxID=1547922 RepID=UPI00372B5B16